MKKMATPFVVFGGALAAFGFSGFEARFGSYLGGADWPIEDRIAIALGIALLLYGAILRKDSK